MCGEDAIDDKVGRSVDEDEQVRNGVQRDEVEWRAVVAARAHAVPYVVGTEKGLEKNKKEDILAMAIYILANLN